MMRHTVAVFLCALALLFVTLTGAQNQRPTPLAANQCELNNRCSVHCFFHGTCKDDGSCACKQGWKGVNCTEPTCDSCGKHGHCTPHGCKCSVGYTGDDCSRLVGVLPFTHPYCSLEGECVCDAHGNHCDSDSRIGPDLVPVMDTIRPYVEYKNFEACSCAVDEGCAQARPSKLLRFSMETLNKGNADLFIGDPGDYMESYLWHQCHQHPHFTHWVNFALIPQFESAHNNTRLGFKSGSTIIDSRRRDQSSASLVRRKFTDKQQGIQIGWTDWYPYWLDCQWIDVTGLELGPYILEVVVNPNHKVHEINYENNRGQMLIDCRPSCVHGKCDFGHSCVCEPGWTGRACDLAAAERAIGEGDEDEGDEHDAVLDPIDADEQLEQGHDLRRRYVVAAEPEPEAEADVVHDKSDEGQEETEQEERVCTPQCEGLHCGPDGCGGACGYCDDFQHCSPDGFCECTPQCLPDRRCGSDSCNGLCGECLEDEICESEHSQCVICEETCASGMCGYLCDGQTICPCPDGWLCDESRTCVCVPQCEGKECGASDGCGGTCHVAGCGNSTCVPNCHNRACGDDGCGGSCGQCAEHFVCLETGQCDCIPDCDGKQCGPDGCGGSCGDCSDTSEGHCFNGQCYCDDSCADIECGYNQCGRSCPSIDFDCSEARKSHGGHNFVCLLSKCACESTCDGLGFVACGPDHCGGVCGDCPSDMRCFNDWRCVEKRDAGVALRGYEVEMHYLTTAFVPPHKPSRSARASDDAQELERARWLRHVTGLLGVPTGSVVVHNWTQTRVEEDHQGNTDAVVVAFSLMSLRIGHPLANASASTNATVLALLATAPSVFAERLINTTSDAASRLQHWDNRGFFSVAIGPGSPGGGGGSGADPNDERWERFATVVVLGLVSGVVAVGLVAVAIIAVVRWRRRRSQQTGLSWVLTEEEEGL